MSNGTIGNERNRFSSGHDDVGYVDCGMYNEGW